MFRIRLLWVGKTREPFIQEGIRFYEKKLKAYVRLSCEEVRPATHRKGNIAASRAEETRQVVQRLDESANTIFLDEKGDRLTSMSFASSIKVWESRGIHQLTFAFGGAYGFDPMQLPANAGKLRISEMTLNHQLVRLMFLEQLYRAFTIIRGEPYHH